MRKNPGFTFIITGFIFFLIPIGIYVWGENTKNSLDASTLSVKTTYETKISNNHSRNDRSFKNRNSISYRKNSSKTYTPIFHYEVAGQRYYCTSSFSSSFKPSDEARLIYYDSQNPQNCYPEKGNMENAFLLIWALVSLCTVGVGIYSLKNPEKIQKYIVKK